MLTQDQNITELKKQMNNIIQTLEKENQVKGKRMIDDIIKRYKSAVTILETKEHTSLSRVDFKIFGGVRAYLDCSSDYDNPVLGEMHKVEQSLQSILNESK
ncbi:MULTISPECIES: hypothetical protein [Bacillus]|uniref:Uncharacterized protein n=2 Tax=Bacillus cereus group TaxID=86661 RepID=A0A9X6XXT8_BACCE|nr:MULTISPECIES: hypothetical protein [Bacillus]MCU7389718.1 hypothetical protein [Bacillus sp. ST24]AKR38608.1 Protein YeeD [Bacillus thuringiensis serovar indiana]ANE89204.1 hypothetical protein DA68_27910 [Bacillus cereus]ASJ51883.1 hypothetical protein BA204_27925 [Bacillus cereus]EJQ01423.1 hypothetical protein IE1_05673 [Bacillus cereus BAG3O-2]